MSIKFASFLIAVIVINFACGFARAQDTVSPMETRLRSVLRDTMLQLRDVQGQLATLQADKDQADKDNVDLKAKVDALTAQVAALTKASEDAKTASDKAIADLNAQVADQAGQVERLNKSVDEWKGAYNQEVQLATAKEDARAKLALQAALLQRTVDDRETKNLELYKTGSEILTRYEKYSLGEAIGAKEPFVGLSRVKLENLVEGYRDKLLNQTVISGQPPALSAPAARTTQQAAPADKSPPKT